MWGRTAAWTGAHPSTGRCGTGTGEGVGDKKLVYFFILVETGQVESMWGADWACEVCAARGASWDACSQLDAPGKAQWLLWGKAGFMHSFRLLLGFFALLTHGMATCCR